MHAMHSGLQRCLCRNEPCKSRIFGERGLAVSKKGKKRGAGGAVVAAPVAATAATLAPALNLPDGVSGSLARIMRPQAAYRWLLPQLSAITPQYIEMVLRGALAGNHVQQWELFDLMLDTWPELAACAQELCDGVLERKLIFEAFAEEDEDPTPAAQERCKLASAAMRRMRPEAAADENDLDGTLRDILDGWFRGVTCLEVDWQMANSGVHGQFVAPRATFWVHPVCFAFDQSGRLGLRVDVTGQGAGQMQPLNLAGTSLQPQPAVLGAFPAHKFLIGIHKAKSGTALGGSLLRPLAWWWCAANFSADWLLNLAQVFGLPFRWANYEPMAPQATVDAICTMLQNMGSAGWAAFPAGTTLELKEASKQGGDHSPQGELLDRADRYARLIILGQTMSGSQDASKGGGKAFGSVESDVKARRINAAAKYACTVLNTQLIPSILVLNYGDSDEAPCVRLLEDEEGDLAQAQRDQVLAAAGLEIPKSFLRKKYGLPAPSEGEEVIGGKAEEPQVSQVDTDFEEAKLEAGEGEGHAFRGNQWTKGIHVAIPDERWTGSPKEMRARADAIYRTLQPATNPTIGSVEFGRAGRKKTFFDKRTPHEFQAVQALPELVAKASVKTSLPDRKERDDIKSVHTLTAGLRIGKVSYRAELTVRETLVGEKSVQMFYLHRLSDRHEPVKGKAAGPYNVSPAFRPDDGPSGKGNISDGVMDVKRLREIAEITDDALFARELESLIEEVNL